MPTGTYTDPTTNEQIKFSVPDGKQNDHDYVDKAIELAKKNKQPIISPPTPEGFLGGLGKGVLGLMDTLGSTAIEPFAGPISAIQTGIDAVASKDPNARQEMISQSRDQMRGLPGIADYNRIAAGDYGGEAGELTPQILAL